MQFRLLGPLRVTADTGEDCQIGRPKLRLLLAILLTRANTVVSAEGLIDSLWGALPPGSARSNLRTYVWTLRGLLSPADPMAAPIITDPPGYLLSVPPECLDLVAFQRLVADGRQARRAGDLALAGKHFGQSLSLWRGPAMEGIPLTCDTLLTTAQRLEEDRLAAMEEFADARIATGRYAEVIADLRTWTVQHPLRERLWEQLMLALYRDSRQAEALAAYQRLRAHLIEEIGVEPGPGPRALQSRILAADPALSDERSRSRVVAEVSTSPVLQYEHSRSRVLAEVSTPPVLQYERSRSPVVAEVSAPSALQCEGGRGRVVAEVSAPSAPPGTGPVVATPSIGVGGRPRQLPFDVPTFVGRAAELASLGAILEGGDASGPGPVVVIHGAPGSGKSALAVRAGNQASAHFPDGQLYINLCGFTSGVEPMAPAEALRRLLRALGAGAGDMSHDLEESAALYRTIVAERRMLILLDNAATVAQLRPLLPGGHGSAVLITSRASLTCLDGSTHLHLRPLTPDDSYAMLARLVADGRTAADARATRQLAELCDHLPLGLHVAASRLKTRPNWAVHHLAGRLADERHRLSELACGDLAVRSSLAVSYAALHGSEDPDDRAAAVALRILGLLRVTDLDLTAAAALCGTCAIDTDRIIERLVDAHLVEAVGPGRYRMHDLVRLFAGEQAAANIPADQATLALSRAFAYYLVTARRATTMLYPHRAHFPRTAAEDIDVAAKPFADQDEARAWLEEERANLVSVARQAIGGPVELIRLGAGLTRALHWFFEHAGYQADGAALNEEVALVARRLGDRAAEAYAHSSLGMFCITAGRWDEARAHLEAEFSICGELGDQFGEQRALGNLSIIHLSQSRPREAVACLQRQLTLAREIGSELAVAWALAALGRARYQLGDADEAVRLTQTSLEWYHKAGDDYGKSAGLRYLAQINMERGRFRAAVAELLDSVECARRIRYCEGESWSLTYLARAWRLAGAPDKALGVAEDAVAIAGRISHTRVWSVACQEHAEALAAARR